MMTLIIRFHDIFCSCSRATGEALSARFIQTLTEMLF